MVSLLRTNSTHQDFIALVKQLDAELSIIDGDEYSFYAQFNRIDKLKHVVLSYENGLPVGCGALKEFDPLTVEIKRMYTVPKFRGQGIASRILGELEAWAAELGYEKCFLETGKRQPAAIALYRKSGYQRIPNYGQYAEVENSLCFEKRLKE